MDIAEHLQRLLLFSPEVYAAVFADYLADSRPVSLVAILAWIYFAWSGWRAGGPAVRPLLWLLALLWLWCGLIFHGYHYASINWAAPYFAAAFVAESVLLAWAASRTVHGEVVPASACRRRLARGWLLVVSVWLLVTAILALSAATSMHRAGPGPDALAWLTIAALAADGRLRATVLVIPALWLPVGAITALLLDDPASLSMQGAAILVLLGLLYCPRRAR